jgi:Protein of unknown function (DUF3352)
MRTMRLFWALLVSTFVLVAAGCGSENVGAGESAGAELLKPGALVYADLDSDPESDQWKQVEELVLRFPDGEKWLAELKKEIESGSEITWEQAHETLGGDSAVAVYASPGAGIPNANVAALLRPDDVDAALKLIERIQREEPDDPLVTRRVDDWIAVSDKEESLDTALKAEGGQALADDEAFQQGMAELPDDALGRVYVDVASAFETFGRGPEAQALRMFGLDELDFAGAWAKARDDGAEVAGVVQGEGADKLLGAAEEYSSDLLELVPADAFAFISFMGTGIGEQVGALRENPLYGSALEEFEQETGVTVAEVLRLIDGEVAFYAAPGAPIPELTLLVRPDDPAQARESAERLLRAVAAMEVGEVTEDGEVTTAVFDDFTVNLGMADDTLVLTTTKDAIADIGSSGEKLADTERYKDALETAGAPDQYTGLAWVDLEETIDLIMGFASVSGDSMPPEVSRNLEPLRSLVAYGDKDGNLVKSLVFVGIE